MDADTESSSVVRRRRRMGRTTREKTPEPNFKPTNGRHRYSDDDSSQLDATTASEEATAQSIRMQIRPPGPMSAHESKILRRRDKTFASAAARSHSQPRQAERLSSPEVFDLLRTTKRSLSSPRHKEESSENEVPSTAVRQLSPPMRQGQQPPVSLHTAPIADENLSRLEQNLRRFEDERKRFESEKRLFEREKREHKLRHKQLHDLEERKRLMQNYRKLSDRIQLPTDDEERRRMVHSLRLQRHAAANATPRERARNRSINYDESSTQFSSSDADADDATARRLAKQTSPVRRNVSAASNYSAPFARGPPPQPPKVPERRTVSRNNSLSPIRPQRRSKTPEQRAELMRKFSETTEALEAPTKLETSHEMPATMPAAVETAAATTLETAAVATAAPKEVVAERRGSLPRSVLRRRSSLESTTKPKPTESVEAPAPVSTPASIEIAPRKTLFQRLLAYFKRDPQRLVAVAPETMHEQQVETLKTLSTPTVVPDKILSRAFLWAFCLEARIVWRRLKADYPNELVELQRYRNKCIAHTIVLIMLCGFGGLMFRYTEGTSENIYKCEVRKVKRDFIDNLWTVSHNMREDDWKSLARQKLRKFEEELYELQNSGPRRYPGMKSWNFVNCILYCWTVITTIGYGHITPKTTAGQAMTIIYAIIGIPMFLILLADFGKLFTRGMKFLWAYVRRLYYTGTCRKIRKQQQVRDAMSGFNAVYDFAIRRPSQFFGAVPDGDVESQTASEAGEKSIAASHPETPTSPYPETFEVDDEFNLPVSLASILLISYILIGALVYHLMEDWSYFASFYFVFISMSTIGFGDLVPNHPIFMMCSIIYLVFGLALTSMFINVVQIKLSDTFKQASAKISATIGLGLASEAGDEDGSQVKTPSELASVHGSRLDKISEEPGDNVTNSQQAPTSILRNARPTDRVSESEANPPPLLPKRSVFKEETTEPEKKKKKGFFK